MQWKHAKYCTAQSEDQIKKNEKSEKLEISMENVLTLVLLLFYSLKTIEMK